MKKLVLWLIASGLTVLSLPSVAKVAHISENLAMPKEQNLSKQDLAILKCNNFLNSDQKLEAFDCLKKEAQKNNPKALYLLALFYIQGEGIPRDINQARQYLELSAKQNLPLAQLYLAIIYSGDYKDFKAEPQKSLYWFQQASENGLKQGDHKTSASADYILGRIYLLGKFGLTDPKLALQYFKKSADLGLAEAQFDMFLYYWNGKFVPKDHKLALSYLQKSANQNFPQAKLALGQIYLRGENVKQNISLGIDYLNSSANQGVADAQIFLAKLYLAGTYVDKNVPRALEILTNLAQKNNFNAINTLGEIYLFGEGVPKSYAEAYKYFKQSADKGNDGGYLGLGTLYEGGLGVQQSYSEAIKYYSKAVQVNNVSAMLSLGSIYHNAKPPYQNLTKARQLFLQAQKLGSQEASYNLGLMDLEAKNYAQAIQEFKRSELGVAYNSIASMYFNGQGVTKSTTEAIKWFQKSIQQTNNLIAKQNLIKIYYFGNNYPVSYRQAFPLLLNLAKEELNYATLGTKFNLADGAIKDFAISIIAESYANGIFLKRNRVLALAWLYKANEPQNVQKYINTLTNQLPDIEIKRAKKITRVELIKLLGDEIHANSGS